MYADGGASQAASQARESQRRIEMASPPRMSRTPLPGSAAGLVENVLYSDGILDDGVERYHAD